MHGVQCVFMPGGGVLVLFGCRGGSGRRNAISWHIPYRHITAFPTRKEEYAHLIFFRIPSFFHRCVIAVCSEGNFDEAESLFREALAINERAHGYRHPEVASCLNSLAALLQVRGAKMQGWQNWRRHCASF